MKSADIIIIGAGAAGMMAAIGAAETSKGQFSVAVLEKMPRPGRKIMITGKGRCNITNTRDWPEFSEHIHPKANPLRSAFYNFSTKDTVEFFNSHGLETVEERGMRIFPASQKAMDVVDTLVRSVGAAGAQVLTGREVASIEFAPEETGVGEGFILKCKNGEEFSCRRLIISTGGLSYPGTGSTGDGYKWAAQAGHSISQCFPSLTAIVPKGYKIIPQQSEDGSEGRGHLNRSLPLSETGKLLCGNELKNISLSLYVDGGLVQEEFGDIDFTDGGLEGSVGFKVSRRCVAAIRRGARVSIGLDLKPAVGKEALEKRISGLWQEIAADRRSQGKPYADKFKVLLGKLMPMSLTAAFLRSNREVDHKKLAARLKDWRLEIEGYVGYERSVITAGGVPTEELVTKTMESKKCPGLYFAGEVIDIDGDTGGYNLQTAFSTGILAGRSAARSLLKQEEA